jgi:hypothetical protein
MGCCAIWRRGRQQAYCDAAIQACLTLKVLFGLPLRQTTGFVASLLKLVGLDWSVPDYSTLCRRQRTLSVAIPYKGSAGPLLLLIDTMYRRRRLNPSGERGRVIPPFLMGSSRRIQAAVFSFMAGVMPPMPMLGRSLL